jgi:hypothetical protein
LSHGLRHKCGLAESRRGQSSGLNRARPQQEGSALRVFAKAVPPPTCLQRLPARKLCPPGPSGVGNRSPCDSCTTTSVSGSKYGGAIRCLRRGCANSGSTPSSRPLHPVLGPAPFMPRKPLRSPKRDGGNDPYFVVGPIRYKGADSKLLLACRGMMKALAAGTDFDTIGVARGIGATRAWQRGSSR